MKRWLAGFTRRPAIVAILAAAAGGAILAASRAAADDRPPAGPTGGIAYLLGAETVPNGRFDRVGPDWQQLRPDEGQKLAIIPEGWLVGYQGGVREMPFAGKDPETGDRCVEFIYGAGRVDLMAPSFPLAGPGTYLLSLRTRSVVHPTAHALRVVLKLLPPEPPAPSPDRAASAATQSAGKAAAAPARHEPIDVGLFEASFPAGPGERVWRSLTEIVQVRGAFARAELHLVKDDDLADFVVDDVSLRRIEEEPRRMSFDIPPGDAGWTSPVVYLGAIDGATLGPEAVVVPGAESAIEVRTGLSPSPDGGWEAWRRTGTPPGEGPGREVHLLARGLALYGQVRVTGSSRAPLSLVLLTAPSKTRVPAPGGITFTRIDDPPPDTSEAWRSILIPPAGACTTGPLAPLRALAIEATSGERDDLSRARAIRAALRVWLPFTAGGDPPARSVAPSPAALIEDCRKPTPLFCRGWEGDIVTAACLCSGLICRSVSSAAAGAPSGGLEGFEVWSRELGRWVYLGYHAGPDDPADATPRSALTLAAASGAPVAIARDLRWGLRGYMLHGPAPASEPADDDSMEREWAPAEAIEFPIDDVHADLVATGDRSFEVLLGHDVPGFGRYLYRHSPSLPWRAVEASLVWRLAPGDNDLEIRAENVLGGTSRVTSFHARVEDGSSRGLSPYTGLRALSGDPHVHTGLGIYRIVDPNHPFVTGTPEKAFDSAVRNGLDWAAVADFSEHIDDPRTLAWRARDHLALKNPDGSETTSEWEHLKAVVRKANQPGRFAAFLGVEFDGGGLSSKGGTGRKLILLPDDEATTWCSTMLQNVGDCPVVEDAFRYARAHRGVMIASMPCSTLKLEDTDWSRYDPIVSLMEMYGGACETAPGGFREVAVGRGLPVGAAGGSDDRTGAAGFYDRTICWASEISRGAILDAIRARRCYWSAAGHLEMAFTINGAPMGSTVAAGDVTAWSVTASSRNAPAFGTVEILRDGSVIASSPCESATRCVIEGGVGEGLPGVYYAAINATDGGRLAITSPVRVAGDEGN